MFLKLFIGWIVLTMIFFPKPFLFSGDIYRWEDERGTIHFTDDASKIPEQFFKQSESQEVSEESSPAEERAQKTEDRHERVKEHLEGIDKRIEMRKKLEKRIAQLGEELRVSEKRLKEIEEFEKENLQYYLPFIDKKTGKIVPMASPYFNEKKGLEKKIESIKSEVKALNKRVLDLVRGL